MIVDCHCHLGLLGEAELAAFVQEIEGKKKEGIDFSCLTLGIDKQDWKCNNSILSRLKFNIKFGVGFHPHWIDNKTDFKDLKHYVNKHKVDVIGEIGLDASHDYKATIYTQQSIAKMSIEIAIEKKLPMVFHVVKAHQLLIKLLKSYGQKIPAFCVHDFVGNNLLVNEYKKFPVFFGINGNSLRRMSAKNLQSLGINQVLFETGYPANFHKQRVPETGFSTIDCLTDNMKKFAEITGRSFEEVKEANAQNFTTFLKRRIPTTKQPLFYR